MVRHIIFIASSYRSGKRIAWHYAAESIDQSDLQSLRDKIEQYPGRPDYAVHKLTTDSESWQSVVEKDSFFSDLKMIGSLDEFLEEIATDKEVTALDIAKYLLSVQPMSNLKLQKMIYLTYADYLTKTGKRLFKDQIISMQYGPVIPTVYDNYKSNGREEITDETRDSLITLEGITTRMTLARMLKADDDQAILSSLKDTLDQFGGKKPSQLVDITHRDGSPWSQVSLHESISDQIILDHHKVELD